MTLLFENRSKLKFSHTAYLTTKSKFSQPIGRELVIASSQSDFKANSCKLLETREKVWPTLIGR